MAERRMFAKTIVLSDAFLDMPLSARCLYFTLGMVADDDGFVNNPKSIMRQCGAQDDDMKILLAKKFLLAFESGVIVIKHWRINNYLQKDRYRETKYLEEKAQLSVDKNGSYHDESTMYTQDMYTQERIDKVSIVKESIVQDNSSCSSNAREELGQVISFYLDKINPTPSQTCIDALKDYTERLSGPVVLHALNIALDERKVNWSYIKAILQSYHRNGLNTMDAVLMAEERHDEGKEKRNSKISGYGPPPGEAAKTDQEKLDEMKRMYSHMKQRPDESEIRNDIP